MTVGFDMTDDGSDVYRYECTRRWTGGDSREQILFQAKFQGHVSRTGKLWQRQTEVEASAVCAQ